MSVLQSLAAQPCVSRSDVNKTFSKTRPRLFMQHQMFYIYIFFVEPDLFVMSKTVHNILYCRLRRHAICNRSPYVVTVSLSLSRELWSIRLHLHSSYSFHHYLRDRFLEQSSIANMHQITPFYANPKNSTLQRMEACPNFTPSFRKALHFSHLRKSNF